MQKDNNKPITELAEAETDFYAQLVPPLLKELTATRKLLQTEKQETAKTKETLAKIYKDYNKELQTSYNLTQVVMRWKVFSLCLLAMLVTFLILGAI